MKRRRNAVVAIGLAFLMLFTSFGGLFTEEVKAVETVRIGFYEMDGFQYYDEFGGLCGYNIDYLNLLSSITGWKYEYVPVKDFQDGCELLLDKQIDLLAPAMWTEERDQLFSYSELSFGTEYTVLVTNKDTSQLFYEDYENFSGLDVAVVTNYPLSEYFVSYMHKHDFSANLIYYDTVEAAREALRKEQVDALVTSIMDVNDSQKLLARFEPQEFYYLTWKGNEEFLTTLNKAMERVWNTHPTFFGELLSKHYPIYTTQFYSREEQEYIAKRDAIRVAYIDDRKPLSFTNDQGELDGISREIFDKIAELSGLKFEYVALPSGDITYDYLLDNQIELITGVEYNSENNNSKEFLLSSPYLSSQKLMVRKRDFVLDLEGKNKVAEVSGFQTLKTVLNGKYPNMEIVNYISIEECFNALNSGEVDLLIQNQYVVDRIMACPRYDDFVVIPMEGLSDQLCFSAIVSLYGKEAMGEEEGLLLISILNKTISQLSEDEMDSIIIKETLENQYDLTLVDFLYNYRFTIAVMFFAILFAITFLIYVYNIKAKERNAKAKEARNMLLQQRRYQLVMDCSEDLIYEISLKGETNIGSDRIKEKFGWEIPRQVDELDISKAMEMLHVHPEDAAIFRQTIHGNGGGNTDELLLRIGKTDGSYIWCRLTRTLLMDDDGSMVSILGKIVDVDGEVKERERLELIARTDPLTGLLNKVAFREAVEEYLKQNSTMGVAFLFMDMDYFKDVNDKLGHEKGDEVIKETARKIQLHFANVDLVSRFGGDEFCVFVKDIPKETLIDKLEFANKRLKNTYFFGNLSVTISASIGGAYCLKEGVTYNKLFEVADAAAYEAKDCGRDCFVIKEIKE